MVGSKVDGVISDWAWVRKADVDMTWVAPSLTVVRHAYETPEPIVEQLFVDRGEWVGVPRAWAVEHLSGVRWAYQVARPVMPTWPSLVWPSGWSWWRGQEAAVTSMVRHLSKELGGLLEAPCGTGKTLMGLAVASRLQMPTLVVVHKNDLASQWKTTAVGGVRDGRSVPSLFPGALVGHVQGNRWDYKGRHVVTALAQTLYSRRNDLPEDFVRSFGLVIYDEGHRYPAATFMRVLSMFPSAARMAVSATWRRKDGMSCVWNWHVGPCAARLVVDRLVGEFFQPAFRSAISNTLFKHRGMGGVITWIAKHAKYNEWLAKQCCRAACVGRRVLLVSDRVDQIVEIERLMRAGGFVGSVGKYVSALPGPDGRRKSQNRGALEIALRCDVILATYGMVSEGTDVPALDTLVLATPRGDVEQVVGRIQRAHSGKRSLVVVDPVFHAAVTRALAAKRERFYLDAGFMKGK